MQIKLGANAVTLPDQYLKAYIGDRLAYETPAAPGGNEPETDALIARMTVAPDAARITAIDTLIATLKSEGIWATLDVFHVFAAHDAQAARLNWKQALFNAVLVGPNEAVFNVDESYGQATGASNTANHIAADGYKPALGGTNFTQAGFCYGTRTVQLVPFREIIAFIEGFPSALLRGESNNMRIRGYGGAYVDYPAPRIGAAAYCYSKNAPDLGTAYLDGTPVGSVADTGSLSGFLQYMSSDWANNAIRLSMVHAGGALSDAQVAALSTAYETYLAAL